MVPFQVPNQRIPAARAERSEAPALPRGPDCAPDDSIADEHSPFLIGMLTQAVFETGPTGEVSGISTSWQAYTGQVLEEARGFGWLSAFHPDDREAMSAARLKATRTGTDLSGEFRLRRADGGWCWTNVRAVPLRGADGRIAKWLGMTLEPPRVCRRGDSPPRQGARRVSVLYVYFVNDGCCIH